MRKKIQLIAILFFAYPFLADSSVLAFWGGEETQNIKKRTEQIKIVTFDDNGIIFQIRSSAHNVADLISEQGIVITDRDSLIPSREDKIYSGSKIIVQRSKRINIIADGEEVEKYTYFDKTEEALTNAGIVVNAVDIVIPSRESFVTNGMTIKLTRVNVEEKISKKEIDFKTIAKEDSDLGWREKKIKQKGQKGIREIKYKITYHNGKEIGRITMEDKITKESVDEIVTQGTFVKIGKKHTGLGTWYAHTGTMAAASPWLPMGSFAKVTNKANGKSVVVKINDRGPFGPNRIIDLDKVAFAKIASLGAGVIDVKVEEVLN